MLKIEALKNGTFKFCKNERIPTSDKYDKTVTKANAKNHPIIYLPPFVSKFTMGHLISFLITEYIQ